MLLVKLGFLLRAIFKQVVGTSLCAQRILILLEKGVIFDLLHCNSGQRVYCKQLSDQVFGFC